MSANNSTDIFRNRRKRFIEAIAGGAAVLPSAPISVRSNDVEYAYRQDSDFYYLTGFSEPESVAVFAPGHKDGEFVLFVRPRDKERETWTGKRAGVEGAMLEYGADKAYAIEELDRVLPRYLENVDRVHYPLGLNEKMNGRMVDLMRKCQAIRPGSTRARALCSIPVKLSTRCGCSRIPRSWSGCVARPRSAPRRMRARCARRAAA